MSPITKRNRAGTRRGMPMLLVFLMVTLGLSLWLGFQAAGAARSHRRTAEGILRDYAEISVAEYSARVQQNMDRFFRVVFDDVPWRIRREPLPSPSVMLHDFDAALRAVDCRCGALRETTVFLRLDLATGSVERIPESLPESVGRRAVEKALASWETDPEERIALVTAEPGEILEEGSVLAFNASLQASGEEGLGRAIYVLLAPLSAAADLFESWYEAGSLLPETVAGSQPNDSLLHLAVRTHSGLPAFLSPRDDPDALLAVDTLPAQYGSLIIEAAVRPDAAASLVIGGLPRSRLPLLFALMALTVGIGAAAFLQIRKEEELGRLRDDFISGVSHEFRTPLTQIRMFTELLADGKLRNEDERVRSTAVINREARRLTHLVENILHFSRLGRAPGSHGTVEDVPVQDLFRDLVEAFSPLCEARECTLEAVVDPPDLVIPANRGALHQMVANLLDNALKYGPPGQLVGLRGVLKEGWIRISVEDEGPGIPPRERARIWDPYRRLERDVTGQVRGSGIGLSVVASLAGGAGGSAWVEDADSGGARFVIELPVDGPGGRGGPGFPEGRESGDAKVEFAERRA